MVYCSIESGGTLISAPYRELLRRTGSACAEDVANDVLGVSIDTEAFWNSSQDLIEAT